MKLILTLTIIISTAFSAKVTGQVKRTIRFSAKYGMFCSQTIILDSTGIFFNESGCEDRSNISFGIYKIAKNNKISLQYLPFDSLRPINKIVEEQKAEENDSMITITFYDRYMEPLEVNVGIRLGDTSNQVKENWTDERGQIEINRFAFKYISLAQFLAIYGETNAIAIGNRSLKVYLNLPRLFLDYPELKVDERQPYSLQLKGKALYDLKTKKIAFKLDQ